MIKNFDALLKGSLEGDIHQTQQLLTALFEKKADATQIKTLRETILKELSVKSDDLAILRRQGVAHLLQGVMHQYGLEQAPPQLDKAIEEYELSIKLGNSFALGRRAYMYLHADPKVDPKGGRYHFIEAMNLYRKAISEENPLAMYELAIYEIEKKEANDYEKAARLLDRAISYGHTDAMKRRALMYIHGKGGEHSLIEPVRLLRHSLPDDVSMKALLAYKEYDTRKDSKLPLAARYHLALAFDDKALLDNIAKAQPIEIIELIEKDTLLSDEQKMRYFKQIFSSLKNDEEKLSFWKKACPIVLDEYLNQHYYKDKRPKGVSLSALYLLFQPHEILSLQTSPPSLNFDWFKQWIIDKHADKSHHDPLYEFLNILKYKDIDPQAIKSLEEGLTKVRAAEPSSTDATHLLTEEESQLIEILEQAYAIDKAARKDARDQSQLLKVGDFFKKVSERATQNTSKEGVEIKPPKDDATPTSKTPIPKKPRRSAR